MVSESKGEAGHPTDSLDHERALVLVRNLKSALPMNSVLGVTIIPIVYDQVSLVISLPWLAVLLSVNAVRFAVVRMYDASAATRNSKAFLRFCCVGAGLSGLTWSAVPLAFLDATNPLFNCVLVILCGISAGATVQSSAYALTAIPFFVPILGTSLVSLLLTQRSENVILAFDVAMFLIFLIRGGLMAQKAFTETTVLKHQATALAADFFELANHDPLTKLANRAAFSAAMNASLDVALAQGRQFHLLLVDLDNFKFINDTLGHSAGDHVLVEVATRLSQSIDQRHGVSRIGGDEFAILLEGSCTDEEAHAIADGVIRNVSGAFVVGGHPVNVGISAGLAKFPDDGRSSEELLGRADLALYAAKDTGRQRWRRFDATLLDMAQMVRDVEQDLPEALLDGSLEVWFQPQVSLHDFRVSGVEALIRWQHPKHGWLAPPLIVKTAQRLRKSEALTGLVLDHACQLVDLLSTGGFTDASVAVNVSPSELEHYCLPDLVERSIKAHDVAPHRLEIEITEETLIGGDGALATLRRLSDIGVRLAIDDFGTGCSSIAYLRTLQVDRIKIDCTFVSGFTERKGDRILVQALLGLGRSFGIEVIAEGVETGDEAALLAEYGCPLAQGYHFGRPMSRAKLLVWLAEHAAAGRPALPARQVAAAVEPAAA